MRGLLRMRLWAQKPRSEKQVKVMLAIVAACLTIYAVERWIGWPAMLTAEKTTAPARVAD